METRYGYNKEGYKDLTATKAIEHLARDARRYRPLVYVCSKYSGDTDANTEAARRYCRFAVDSGAIPLAPHLLFPQFMSDETERELAMFMNKVLLLKCDEVWVFGEEASSGMKAEISSARRNHKKLRYFREDCTETEDEI